MAIARVVLTLVEPGDCPIHKSGDRIVLEPPALIVENGAQVCAVALVSAYPYALAMASNYNLSLRPPVVLVKDGEAKLMRRRETYEDLTRADVWPLE